MIENETGTAANTNKKLKTDPERTIFADKMMVFILKTKFYYYLFLNRFYLINREKWVTKLGKAWVNKIRVL